MFNSFLAKCRAALQSLISGETRDNIIASVKSFFTRERANRLLAALRDFFISKPFVYGVGTFIALFVLLNYAVMPWYVYHGGTLTVPSVTGMQFEEARNKLLAMGLVPFEGDTILDNSLPVGAVASQNPLPNAIVKYGRHVYLTVCGGEVVVVVPSLRGRSLRDARFALERNGLELGEIHYAPSDANPVNTIMSQTVAAMEKVKRGERVGVTLSSGGLTNLIEVPNVIGKSLSEAQKILEQVGLDLGRITYQVNTELLPNSIVDQFPQAGAAVDSGKTIDLFVVKSGTLEDEN